MTTSKLLFALTIHTQPLPKERPASGKNGRRITPVATRTFEETTRVMAQNMMAQLGLDVIEGDIRLVLGFGREGKTRADYDNLAKAVGDGLNKVVYKDDKQIIQGRQDVIYGLKKGCGVYHILVYQAKQNPQRMAFYAEAVKRFQQDKGL